MGIDYLHLMMLYNVHFSCITAAAGTRSTKVMELELESWSIIYAWDSCSITLSSPGIADCRI